MALPKLMLSERQRSLLLARGIFTFHASFMALLFVGAFASFIFPAIAPWEVTATLIVLLLQKLYGGCALTQLEVKYRRKANPNYEFQGTFYGHYFFKGIFGVDLPRTYITIFLVATKIIPGLLPIIVILGWV